MGSAIFTFRHQQTTGGEYFLLGVFGIPLVILLLSTLLFYYTPWVGLSPINYRTSVSIPKGEEPTDLHFVKDREHNTARAILREYEGTYFYMAVKEHDGMSLERFEKIVSIVTADLNAFGVDTEQFQQKQFNNE